MKSKRGCSPDIKMYKQNKPSCTGRKLYFLILIYWQWILYALRERVLRALVFALLSALHDKMAEMAGN